MTHRDLELQPLEGLYRWLGPTLARFALRLLSMEELPQEQMSGLLTTQDGFFRRDRHVHPAIPSEGWQLQLGGVAQPRAFGYAELEALPQQRAACVAECAGNGNHLMGSAGLMGQACWQGPTVQSVVEACGGPGEATHFVFHGADSIGPRGAYHYGLSWQEIIDSGAILALRHGDEPLTRARGYPLRLVVPGIYAMAGLVFEICKKNRIPIKPLSTPVDGIDDDDAMRLEQLVGDLQLRAPAVGGHLQVGQAEFGVESAVEALGQVSRHRSCLHARRPAATSGGSGESYTTRGSNRVVGFAA